MTLSRLDDEYMTVDSALLAQNPRNSGETHEGTCLAQSEKYVQLPQLCFRERRLRAWCAWMLVLSAALCLSACVQGQRATDTGDPGFPFGPSAIGVQTIAYVQDIKPIFDRDCAECHGGRENAGNYSVSTYANVLSGQRPGDASGSLVVDCSPGGSMYRYFSGDAATKATMVFRWMVYYNALERR
jgi:hypothetical protein